MDRQTRRGAISAFAGASAAAMAATAAAQQRQNLLVAGLWTRFSEFTAPQGLAAVRSSGFDRLGEGIADYVIDPDQRAGESVWRKRSANGVWFKLAPASHGLDAAAFGVRGDGSDGSAALAACADFYRLNQSEFYAGGGVIWLPPGLIRCTRPMAYKRTLIWRGASGGQYGGYSTVIEFARDCPGFIFDAHNSAKPSARTGQGASTSGIENLTLRSLGGTNPDAHAIHARHRFYTEHVTIEGFPGDGYHIVATARSAIPVEEGNSNCFSIRHGRVETCRNGLLARGGDANAGSVSELDCSYNREWGIDDQSFLGNLYSGCHTANNKAGPYRSLNPNARTLFLNCYSEGGQPPSRLVYPAMAVGGLHGSGWTPDSTGQRFDDAGLKVRPGETNAPGRSWTTDQDTGWTNHSDGRERFYSNGDLRLQLDDAFKASTDGRFVSEATAIHELVQSAPRLTTSIDYARAPDYAGPGKIVETARRASTDFSLLTLQTGAGQAFRVAGNGAALSAVNSYGALSDARLKFDVAPARSAWDDFKRIAFVNFRLKQQPALKQLGVVAQQVAEVSPGLVERYPDEDGGEVLGVKHSVLTLKGLCALQEAMARIEVLEARLAKLDAAAAEAR